MERNDKLIKSKFYKYLLPGIMMVAAMQLGDLVDSIFVGNLLGTDALSAINLGMPVVYMAQIPIMIMASGGSIVAAICLGKRQIDRASAIFSASMAGVFVFNLLNAVCAFFYSEPLAGLLSGGGELKQMTADFIWLYIAGMPLIGIGLMISYFMGVDNHPFESAALHIVANVINLVTDYIFLKFWHLGIRGSVFSTIAGYGIAGILFGILYLTSKKRTLKLKADFFAEEKELIVEAVKNGMSSGLLLALSSAKMFVLNAAILVATGNEGMAMYAVCINSFFIIQLCLHGISGVIQTICGVLYGEKDYYAIRVVLRQVTTICTVVSVMLMAVFFLFPGWIEQMFGFDLPEQLQTMDLCLRVYALSFVGYAFNNIMQTYYSTIENSFLAIFNTVLQGFVLVVPFTLMLIPTFGIVGTSIAAVIAETGTVVMTAVACKMLYRRGKVQGKGFDLLPEKQNERFVDVTVEGNIHNAAAIAHKLKEYCLCEGVNSRSANIVAVAGEELVRNIAENLDKKRSYIDICLVNEPDGMVLRIRDDGALYNPFENTPNERESEIMPEDLSEIEIVKKLAKKIEYSRVLNMNNTVVIIDDTIGEVS